MKKTKENAEITAKETVKKASEKAKTTNKNKSKNKPEPKEVEVKPTTENMPLVKDTVSDIVDKLKNDNKHKLEFQFIKLANELRNALSKTQDIKSDFIVRKSKLNSLEEIIKNQIEFINEMKNTFKQCNS